MKILILTSYKYENPISREEYKKQSSYKLFSYLLSMKHEVTLTRYSDLAINIKKTMSILSGREDILNFDLIIFRTTTESMYKINNGEIAQAVARFCKLHNKKTINGNHFCLFPHDFNKLFQMQILHESGLPIPETFFYKEKYLRKNLSFPIVEKPIVGSHGKNVYLINNFKEIKLKNSILQEVLPNRTDYRILVLNHKCLGGMRRSASATNFVSNYSAGGSVSPITVSEEMEQLSIRCSKIFELDFCGIDLMKSADGSLKVLEVNRFPEFNGFQKATKINVSEKILQSFQ